MGGHEVRPDGLETYVQSGWLRATLRRGRFTPVTVPLYYEGHVYRAGSRIRITISAPGGDQPTWAFTALEPGIDRKATVRLAHSGAMPSRLVLPVVAGVRLQETVAALKGAGLRVLAADGRASSTLDDPRTRAALSSPTAWLFGNEAWGLPDDLLALADETVAVPIYGRAESLNLAAAAAVCLYGSARAQRRG